MKKQKKILYLFSDTGGGHRSAAMAIMSAVDIVSKKTVKQEMVDVFAHCSKFLNIFATMYGKVVNAAPFIWKFLYYFLDSPGRLKNLERITFPFMLEEFKNLIKKEQPDAIVSVHPLVNHLTVRALRELGLHIPFIVVVTDPVSFHRAWVAPDGVDLLIVATEEAKQLASEYGATYKTKVIGMPIDPKFIDLSRKADKTLPSKVPTIMMMGGGEGGGNILPIVKEINKKRLKVNLIIIAGRNAALEKKLKLKAKKFKVPMKVYGFTYEVPQIMKSSDLLITKAGPGSIAEALVMYLPMIVTSWIPGQEEGNVEFVRAKKLGYVGTDPKKVPAMVEKIIEPQNYQKIQANIKRARRPEASIDIARSIFELL